MNLFSHLQKNNLIKLNKKNKKHNLIFFSIKNCIVKKLKKYYSFFPFSPSLF